MASPWTVPEGSFERMLRWFARSPRGSGGHGCPEGAVRGTKKGSRNPCLEGTVWCWFGKGLVEGKCGEMWLRQIAAGGYVIRKEQ